MKKNIKKCIQYAKIYKISEVEYYLIEILYNIRNGVIFGRRKTNFCLDFLFIKIWNCIKIRSQHVDALESNEPLILNI